MSHRVIRNITLLFLGLTWAIASCKPDPAPKPDDQEPPKQYSYWVVNEDSFSTNNVTLSIGKAEAFLSANQQTIYDNSFTIHFNTGYRLPTTGSFLLNCNADNSDVVCFSIVYDSVGYYEPATLQYLQASKKNGKAEYSLAPTWFYSEIDPNDSVLIHGVFNEP